MKAFSILRTIWLYLAALAVMPITGAEMPLIKDGQVTIGSARFTVVTPECIRLEFNRHEFVDAPSFFAVSRPVHGAEIKATDHGSRIEIDTGRIQLAYLNDGNSFNPANLKAVIRDGSNSVEWQPGLTNSGNLGGTERTLDNFDGPRGKISDGVISRDGWALVDDSRSVLLKRDWFQARPHAEGETNLDWYLFGYGKDYRAALQALTTVSGPAPMPRRYLFGAWYSRYWPYSSEDFRNIVKEYAQHDFPLDVIVMDMDWHITKPTNSPARLKLGWTGYTWNRDLLPDAEDLLKWFHAQGLAVTLNDHPADGVWPHESMYAEFTNALAGFATDTNGHIPFDAGSRKYLDPFYAITHVPLEQAGVDFWWLDWQQQPRTRSVPELPNLTALNEYYYDHSQAEGKRGVSFSRWAGFGDQRHPIHFSGDASTSFKMLAFEVPFTSTAGNVGCFFWSHDIGGHNRGRNEESYARWCQFGAFSTALRSHSTRSADMDRRPWTYPDWAENSMRTSFHLRSRFFPYTYTAAHETCADSVPLVRPIYFACPEADAAYRQPQEYLYGNDMLVAPVAEAGAGPQRLGRQVVWFPTGTWYDFFSGERFEGQHERLVAAAIDEFPLYMRGGVPIPMSPYVPRMATAPLTNLIVRCYPGIAGQTQTSTLYEDDGISQAYKSGAAAQTRLAYSRNGNKITLDIAPTVGMFDGQPAERAYVIELPCTKKATEVQVDGTSVAAEYIEAEKLNRISISARSIRSGCRVELVVEEADQTAIQMSAFAKRAGVKETAEQTTLAMLIQTATNNCQDAALKTAMLAAAHTGIFEKIESPTGFPNTKVAKTYSPSDP